MNLFWKLFTPLQYLQIKHKQKQFVDLVLPLFISIVGGVTYAFLLPTIDLFGDKGLISKLGGFLQILSGFYVAALAAIATFQNANMDVSVDGFPLYLKERELTRRQFLSYLFGYLAFTGFFLVLLGIFAQFLAPFIESGQQTWKATICAANQNKVNTCTEILDILTLGLKAASLSFYLFWFFSILLTTMLGLYYLTEKIHENKAEFVDSTDDTNDEPEDF